MSSQSRPRPRGQRGGLQIVVTPRGALPIGMPAADTIEESERRIAELLRPTHGVGCVEMRGAGSVQRWWFGGRV